MAAPVAVTIANNAITVSPDPLPVRGLNVQLQWNIQTSGWTFPTNGIVLKNGNGTQFHSPIISEQGRRFILVDNNSSPGQYPYTVNVVDGSGNTLTLDPIILNEGTEP